MADRMSLDPKVESFEQFEERFIFDGSDFFLYRKHGRGCKEAATSFREALRSKPSSRHDGLHLHQRADEPINAKILRSVAINCSSRVVSVCFGSMELTDKLVEGVLPHLSKLKYLQFNGVGIGSVAARAVAIFCHNTLESLRISGCRLITSESCGMCVLRTGATSSFAE